MAGLFIKFWNGYQGSVKETLVGVLLIIKLICCDLEAFLIDNLISVQGI